MMEYVNKFEKTVLAWMKNVPHLPVAAQKWLGVNVWWIALVGAIISGIAVLFTLSGLFTLISLFGAPSNAYFVTSTYVGYAVLATVVRLFFLALGGILLALAVKPLQTMQKKGWVLLFMTLLVNALFAILSAVSTFSITGFIMGVIFGAVALAIAAYFVAEIHGQFAHKTKATPKKG